MKTSFKIFMLLLSAILIVLFIKYFKSPNEDIPIPIPSIVPIQYVPPPINNNYQGPDVKG